MIYFFFDLCMYVRGFASYIFVRISFLGGGGILCSMGLHFVVTVAHGSWL